MINPLDEDLVVILFVEEIGRMFISDDGRTIPSYLADSFSMHSASFFERLKHLLSSLFEGIFTDEVHAVLIRCFIL